ncbi:MULTISPECIES: hypothetical protein [Paenibacillus]|uniref:hypothetical protein n=1 Tax=Paenibacillus TaxID=44249 RepID=UPI00096EC5D3|nr:hypothetical protein [Paenibacillus odorifer]OME40860.1 hypothetical protein BSK58_15355 [Paenibacillus odorifer]
MSLHDDFILECKRMNLTTNKEKAKLLYKLISNNPRSRLVYSRRDGHSFDQYWTYSKITPTAVLIQATEHRSGNIEISMHGLRSILSGAPNFLNFFVEEDQRIFLEYLTLF